MKKSILFKVLASILILTNLIFVVGKPSEALGVSEPFAYWEFINRDDKKHRDHTKLFISVDPRDIQPAKIIFRQFLLDKKFYGKLPQEGVSRSALIIYEDNVSRYDIIDLEKRLLKAQVRPKLLKAGERIPDRAIAGSLYTYYKYDGPEGFVYNNCMFYDSIHQVNYMDCIENPNGIARGMRYREESGHENNGIPRTLSNYMNMESIHEELSIFDQRFYGDLFKMFGYMNLLSSHRAVQRQLVEAFFRVKLSKYQGEEKSTDIDWNGLTPDFIEQNLPCIRRIFEATQDLPLKAVRRILSNILKGGGTTQEPIMLESAYKLFEKVEAVDTKEETKEIFYELLGLKYGSQLQPLLSCKKFQDYVVNNWKPSCNKEDYLASMDLENPFNNAFLGVVGDLNKKESDNIWKGKYEDYIKLFDNTTVWHKILIDAVAYKTYFLGYKSGKISKMSRLDLVRDFVVCKFSLVKNILAETKGYSEGRIKELAVKIQASVDSCAGDMALYNSLMKDEDVSNINAKIAGLKPDSNALSSLPTPSSCPGGWYECIWDPSSFFNKSDDSKIFLQQFLEKLFKLNCKKVPIAPETVFAVTFSKFLSVLAVASPADVRAGLDSEIARYLFQGLDASLRPFVWRKLLSKYIEPSFAHIPDYIYNSFIDSYENDLGKDIDNNDILNTKVKDDLRNCFKKIFSYRIINNEKEFKNCREELINIFNDLNSAYMQKNRVPLVTSSKPYLILSNFCIAKTLEDFQNVVYTETLKAIRRDVAQRLVDEGGPLMSKFDDNAPILFRGNCVDDQVASGIMINGEVGTNFFLDIVRNSNENLCYENKINLFHKNYLSFTPDIKVANKYATAGNDGKIFVVLPKKNRCFCSPIFHNSYRTNEYSEIDLVSTENEDILGYFELPEYKFVANLQYNEKHNSMGNNMKNIFTDGEKYKDIESINNILNRYNNQSKYDNIIETYKGNSREIIKFMADNPAFMERFVEYFRLNVVDNRYAFPTLADSLKKRFKRLLNKLEEDPDSIFKDTTLLSMKLLNNSSYTSLKFFPYVYRFILDLKSDFERTFNDQHEETVDDFMLSHNIINPSLKQNQNGLTCWMFASMNIENYYRVCNHKRPVDGSEVDKACNFVSEKLNKPNILDNTQTAQEMIFYLNAKKINVKDYSFTVSNPSERPDVIKAIESLLEEHFNNPNFINHSPVAVNQSANHWITIIGVNGDDYLVCDSTKNNDEPYFEKKEKILGSILGGFRVDGYGMVTDILIPMEAYLCLCTQKGRTNHLTYLPKYGLYYDEKLGVIRFNACDDMFMRSYDIKIFSDNNGKFILDSDKSKRYLNNLSNYIEEVDGVPTFKNNLGFTPFYTEKEECGAKILLPMVGSVRCITRYGERSINYFMNGGKFMIFDSELNPKKFDTLVELKQYVISLEFCNRDWREINDNVGGNSSPIQELPLPPAPTIPTPQFQLPPPPLTPISFQEYLPPAPTIPTPQFQLPPPPLTPISFQKYLPPAPKSTSSLGLPLLPPPPISTPPRPHINILLLPPPPPASPFRVFNGNYEIQCSSNG